MSHYLVSEGLIPLSAAPSRVALSDDGDYLIAHTDAGEVLYANWRRDRLWEGRVSQPNAAKVAVSPDRLKIIVNQNTSTQAVAASGERLWGFYSEDWRVENAWLNGRPSIVAGIRGNTVANLGSEGLPLWTYQTEAAARDIAISIAGDALVVGTERGVVCLGPEDGRLRWRKLTDLVVLHVGFGRDWIVAADSAGQVHCLDTNGELLAMYKADEGGVGSVAISGTKTGFVAVGVKTGVRLLRLQQDTAGVLFKPKLPERLGLRDTLLNFEPGEVQNLHLSLPSSSIVVETASAFIAYSLDGARLSSYQKLPPIDKPVIIVPPPPLPPPPPPEQIIIDRVEGEFIEYTRQRGVNKTDKAKTRTSVMVGSDTLDVYYDAKGYLFVKEASTWTVARAKRLAERTDIYIVAYYASDDVFNEVRRTKHVDLYRLSDMRTTAGLFGRTEFDTFIQQNYQQSFT